MHRILTTSGVAWVALSLAVAPAAVEGGRAQSDLAIDHQAVECLPTTRFTLFTALVRPVADLQHARLYFRAEQYSEFYYVNMKAIGADRYQASIPLPAEETRRVIYYIEAMTRAFQSARTSEYLPEVTTEDDCRRRHPAAAYFPGTNPAIQVFPTQAGAAFPPGFLTGGVIPAVSGGIGVGTAILIGAAGAGATAGVIAAVGDESTSTSTVLAATTSAPPTTTTALPPASVKACFDTSPNPPIIYAGDSIRLDASCSEPRGSLNYYWDLGDGRERDGRVVTPLYQAPGIYTVTLTVGQGSPVQLVSAAVDSLQRDVTVLAVTTTTTVGPGPGPAPTSTTTSIVTTTSIAPNVDLAVTITGPANVPVAGNGVYNVTVTNSGPQTDPAVTLNVTFAANSGAAPVAAPLPPGCTSSTVASSLNVTCNIGAVPPTANRSFTIQFPAGNIYTNTAQVAGAGNDINPGNNTAFVITNVPLRFDREEIATSFASFLAVAPFDGGARGELLLNGAQLDTVDSSASVVHQLRGHPGGNTVEARLLAAAGQEGFWRFDFSSSANFEPGTLTVESGEVLALDGRTVVFRLAGVPGERVKFSYRLRQ